MHFMMLEDSILGWHLGTVGTVDNIHTVFFIHTLIVLRPNLEEYVFMKAVKKKDRVVVDPE